MKLGTWWRTVGVTLLAMMTSTAALADWSDLNMPVGVTEISRQVHDLHMIIFGVCVVIGILVFGTMIVSMLMHRKSLGVTPAEFHENTQIEILWTVIPIVILLVMAWPATTTLRAMYDAGESDIDIEVRGYQWKWQYTYLNDDQAKEVKFMSNLSTPQEEIYGQASKGEHYLLEVDEPLVIPVGKRVRFLITSDDVIHSWWVPDFAVKKDAIPGFIHESWAVVEKEGIYRGKCAELCGIHHGFMPIEVHAVSQADYDAWLAAKQQEAAEVYETIGKEWTRDELMTLGEEVYMRSCASCHQPNGQGIPPAFPALAGSPVATGPIRDHINIILHGRDGTAMQAFAAQLGPHEIAAVTTYERNAWGNNVGDLVQPKEIAAMLSGEMASR